MVKVIAGILLFFRCRQFCGGVLCVLGGLQLSVPL